MISKAEWIMAAKHNQFKIKAKLVGSWKMSYYSLVIMDILINIVMRLQIKSEYRRLNHHKVFHLNLKSVSSTCKQARNMMSNSTVGSLITSALSLINESLPFFVRRFWRIKQILRLSSINILFIRSYAQSAKWMEYFGKTHLPLFKNNVNKMLWQ